MENQIKGILIDSESETITEVVVNRSQGSFVNDIYKYVKCDCFSVVYLDPDDLFVDDNSLLNLNENSKFFSTPSGMLLCGNGLILGLNHSDGESKSATMDIEKLKKQIKFYKYEELH